MTRSPTPEQRDWNRAQRLLATARITWATALIAATAACVAHALSLARLLDGQLDRLANCHLALDLFPWAGNGAAVALLAAGVALPTLVFRRALARVIGRLATRRTAGGPYRGANLALPEAAETLRARHAAHALTSLVLGLLARLALLGVAAFLVRSAADGAWAWRSAMAANALGVSIVAVIAIALGVPTRGRIFGRAVPIAAG